MNMDLQEKSIILLGMKFNLKDYQNIYIIKEIERENKNKIIK